MTTTGMTGRVATRKSGCGCGGGGGGCGCGGGCSGSALPARGASFVRPRFFGGMLLTEDDLQAIDDYVLAKRRLTNRSVLGTGVVCGLDVTCDPCSTDTVLVTPGYAIDCCGNDIVVECPETVDVLALVRDLRSRLGVDCGEPCDDDEGSREYVLNVVYAEELTEPVAPYTTDECATGDCDYSRVREGYRFELSCEASPAEPTIVDVMRQCLDLDRDDVDADAQAMVRVVEIARTQEPETIEETGAATAEPKLTIPTKSEFAPFEVDDPELLPALDVLGRTVAVLSADAAHRAGRDTPGVLMNAERRNVLSELSRNLAERLSAPERLRELPASQHDRVVRLLNTAREQRDLERITAADRTMFASFAFASADVEEEYLRETRRLRSRVLQGLADSSRRGCRDYHEVAGLKLERLDARAPEEARILARSFLAMFARCLCTAANPPCPACTDALVPIARVGVRGCDVISVCALERHWVHSPRALAYWFPVVEAIRENLEARCCRDERHAFAYRQPSIRERELDVLRRTAMETAMVVRPPEEVPAFRSLMEALGDQFVEGFRRPESASPYSRSASAATAAEPDDLAEIRRRLDALEGKPT